MLTTRPLPVFSRRWVYWFYLSCFALLFLLILCVLILDTRPHPDGTALASPELPATPRVLLRQMVDANAEVAGEKRLVMSARDIERVAALLLARRQTEGRIRCRADSPRLLCEVSFRLTAALPLFINVAVLLDSHPESGGTARIHLGQLAFSAGLISNFLRPLASLAGYGHYVRLWEQRVTGWHVQDDLLQVSVLWKDEWFDLAENWVEDWVSRERHRIYDLRLRKILALSSHTRFVRLGHLMYVLFGLARDRSLTDDLAMAENTAVIRVLNAYVNGTSRDGNPGHLKVLLNGRVDTAQHFLASAALALTTTGEFSHLMGLAKELNDTHGGSGFSFVDLAADRSGIIFARLATATGSSARMIQEVLSRNNDESRFMVDTRGLPENLERPDFGSPQYHALETLIDNRVAGLAINSATR